jgi:osmotically-inducible protein OsmY
MRKYGKWALTLGLLAATPGVPQSAIAQGRSEPPAAKQSAKSYNQQMADKIAEALRAERLAAYEVEIEFKDGIATIKGMIADKKQKQRARDAVAKVPGVTQVDDSRLAILPKQKLSDRMRGTPGGVVQAGHTGSDKDKRVQQVSAEEGPAGAIQSNQQVAEQIGAALSHANLDGYDIEIRYQNGVAMLEGKVPTNAQRAQAAHVAGSVPGVRSVANRLQVTEERPLADPSARLPMGVDPRMAQVYAAAYHGEAGPGAAVPPPAPYAHPGAGMSPASYTMPYVPEHAWPAYAQYPNSAAVTYPQQYSASAWPYIGPFYPYPQVPLGWRDATLRWDDGQWNLQFRQRTDKWFWFLHPRNW